MNTDELLFVAHVEALARQLRTEDAMKRNITSETQLPPIEQYVDQATDLLIGLHRRVLSRVEKASYEEARDRLSR